MTDEEKQRLDRAEIVSKACSAVLVKLLSMLEGTGIIDRAFLLESFYLPLLKAAGSAALSADDVKILNGVDQHVHMLLSGDQKKPGGS